MTIPLDPRYYTLSSAGKEIHDAINRAYTAFAQIITIATPSGDPDRESALQLIWGARGDALESVFREHKK
jgi:hypothetical protein